MKFPILKIHLILLLGLTGPCVASSSDNPMQVLEDKGYQLSIINSAALNKTFATYSGNHASVVINELDTRGLLAKCETATEVNKVLKSLSKAAAKEPFVMAGQLGILRHMADERIASKFNNGSQLASFFNKLAKGTQVQPTIFLEWLLLSDAINGCKTTENIAHLYHHINVHDPKAPVSVLETLHFSKRNRLFERCENPEQIKQVFDLVCDKGLHTSGLLRTGTALRLCLNYDNLIELLDFAHRRVQDTGFDGYLVESEILALCKNQAQLLQLMEYFFELQQLHRDGQFFARIGRRSLQTFTTIEEVFEFLQAVIDLKHDSQTKFCKWMANYNKVHSSDIAVIRDLKSLTSAQFEDFRYLVSDVKVSAEVFSYSSCLNLFVRLDWPAIQLLHRFLPDQTDMEIENPSQSRLDDTHKMIKLVQDFTDEDRKRVISWWLPVAEAQKLSKEEREEQELKDKTDILRSLQGFSASLRHSLIFWLDKTIISTPNKQVVFYGPVINAIKDLLLHLKTVDSFLAWLENSNFFKISTSFYQLRIIMNPLLKDALDSLEYQKISSLSLFFRQQFAAQLIDVDYIKLAVSRLLNVHNLYKALNGFKIELSEKYLLTEMCVFFLKIGLEDPLFITYLAKELEDTGRGKTTLACIHSELGVGSDLTRKILGASTTQTGTGE